MSSVMVYEVLLDRRVFLVRFGDMSIEDASLDFAAVDPSLCRVNHLVTSIEEHCLSRGPDWYGPGRAGRLRRQ